MKLILIKQVFLVDLANNTLPQNAVIASTYIPMHNLIVSALSTQFFMAVIWQKHTTNWLNYNSF